MIPPHNLGLVGLQQIISATQGSHHLENCPPFRASICCCPDQRCMMSWYLSFGERCSFGLPRLHVGRSSSRAVYPMKVRARSGLVSRDRLGRSDPCHITVPCSRARQTPLSCCLLHLFAPFRRVVGNLLRQLFLRVDEQPYQTGWYIMVISFAIQWCKQHSVNKNTVPRY